MAWLPDFWKVLLGSDMDVGGFMDQYYDWASFEKFVTELYEEEGEVTVQRDVTDVDRYGAIGLIGLANAEWNF